MSVKAKIALILGAATLLGLPAPAGAAPVLDLQMTRTTAPVTHSDERLAFEATVSNQGSQIPNPGDTLQCQASAGGNPPASITYQWLREGDPTGITTPSYLTGAADEGKSLQCKVTATNDPDDVLFGGNEYPPLAGTATSLPPVVVAPVPSPAPPSGSTRPALGGPPPATPVGTGTVVEGSNVISDVITAKGSGDLTATSKVVTDLVTATGKFMVGETGGPQQVITGAGIPAGTTVAKIISPSSIELSQAVTGGGGNDVALEAGAIPFQQNQKLSGAGIPAGATITNVTGETLTISAPATESNAGVALTGTAEKTCGTPAGWSGSGITWSFQWLRNGQAIGGATSPTYTVQAADTEPPSFMQCEATAKDSLGREAVAISSGDFSRPAPPAPYLSPAGASATIPLPNPTAGEVTVQAELPAGTQALRAAGSGWACVKTPPTPTELSTIECNRADALAPGSSFPKLELIAQVAPDAPDTLTTEVCASGGGAAELPCLQDTVSGILPAVPFGFAAFETKVLDELGGDFTQAGGHPFSAGAALKFNEHMKAEISENGLRAGNGFVREVRTEVPAGFAGNPEAEGLEKCETVADVTALPSNCPAASVVGGIALDLSLGGFSNSSELPIYALEPEKGTPAQFAFGVAALRPGFAFTLTPELRPEDNYGITLVAAPVSKVPEVFGAEATLCGFGAKTMTISSGEIRFAGCRKANEAGALDQPFISLPTRCGDPASVTTRILADSWEDPGNFASASFEAPALTGCAALEFDPSLKASPTAKAADSPSGLEVELEIPQNQDPNGTATAQLKKTVLTLPPGLTVNPSGANGLDACSPAQIDLGKNTPVGCPEASKIGTVKAETPILEDALPGTLYVATPRDNPFGSLLALYLVIEDPETGLIIKLPGRMEAGGGKDVDPALPPLAPGQLRSVFDELPQAPVSATELRVRAGNTAPLRSPTLCGEYASAWEMTPWSAPDSGPPVQDTDPFEIEEGAGGAGCRPSEADLPNAPTFEAGSTSPIAGAYSPFVLRLARADGSQEFSQVDLSLPPGLTGKLAGVPNCPDAALAAAAAKSGRAELASPSCPAASEVGSVTAGAGAGPTPYFTTGKAYIAGPYKGAPLSVAVITPAVAGPFDIGTVVVRSALYLDPVSAQVTARTDPLPTHLEGIPLDVRSIEVKLDRPEFTLNPTSCETKAFGGQLRSTVGGVALLTKRFQVGECGRLGFKPRLKLHLHGGTKRGDFGRLVATLTYPKGAYANAASIGVTLPSSMFLAQQHIRTICTRVQFAADQCPKGSIYGKVTATTPLLDGALRGPVYLRASSNPLPDLVMALRGPEDRPVEVEAVGRIDSKNGGIRNRFEFIPDAPLAKVTLKMRGGKKSLILNSRNLCKSTQRATVRMTAHNGKRHDFRPAVGNDCRKKKGGKKGRGRK